MPIGFLLIVSLIVNNGLYTDTRLHMCSSHYWLLFLFSALLVFQRAIDTINLKVLFALDFELKQEMYRPAGLTIYVLI